MMTAPACPAATAASDTAWAVLDDRAEWEAFSRPEPAHPGRWVSQLSISGMTCAACTFAVEAALNGLPGVHGVRVNGGAATARLEWSPEQGARPSEWFSALERAGYPALPAGDLLDARPRQRQARVLLWRWLVAGFCMMQVMMYAAPAYLEGALDITAQDQALLRWASWVLTLPVLLFSCQPFFASAWRDLRRRRVGMDVPVALGVLIAFGASSAATFDPTGPLGAEVWFDSLTMFAFFLLSGRLLEQRLQGRTAGALEALMRKLPAMVERQEADGSWSRVAVRRLAAGDRVRVLPGDVMPADGRVEVGDSQVDEALLTGESLPLRRTVGDRVVAGSHNLSGTLQLLVERTGADTRYAEIVSLMDQASADKPALAQAADRIAGPFLVAVLLAAAAAALWWWPQGPAHALGVAMAVLIVTCPCALSLATPAATLASAGALARRGLLVRRLQALEACATIDTVVFDKTGTLTEDRMAARLLGLREGADAAVVMAAAAAIAGQSLHPAAQAVARLAGPPGAAATSVTETPGQGVSGTWTPADGAPRHLRLGSAAFCAAPPAMPDARVYLADEHGWLAAFGLDEALRADAVAAIGVLKQAGLGVRLLSGDRPAAVARLAAQAGIGEARGHCTPEDKLAHVERLQRGGHRVAMVGDGMNDGPVLARADVSIALGSAVPLAQARSDFVIQGGQLSAVPLLWRQARRTRQVVRQNLAWAAVYNAVCVPLALAGAMPPWLAGLGMAASSLLVVLNSARLARIS